MMGEPISLLERQLAEYADREHCICTGSGTSALAVALRALNLPPGSEVVLPSICCVDIPLAVQYAGLIPVFCDVGTNNYNMDVKLVESVLSPRTRAMIAVHLFGYPCEINALLQLAQEKSLTVVEDAAQALGGSLGPRKLGSFGELSIMSFGNRKIIDAGGGGAVLTDDHSLAREIRQQHQLRNRRVDDLTAMASEKLGNLAARLTAMLEARGIRMPAQLPGQSNLYWRTRFRSMTPSSAEHVSRALGTLADVVSVRRRNVMIYRETISSPHVSHPTYDRDNWACFRYSVLANAVPAERVRAALQARGIWTTTLYPSLHRMRWRWGSTGNELRNAEMVETHILNLMVAETYPEGEIRRMAKTLNEFTPETHLPSLIA